eukprot:4098113-Alexandrium_andersonii.AAC.1
MKHNSKVPRAREVARRCFLTGRKQPEPAQGGSFATLAACKEHSEAGREFRQPEAHTPRNQPTA